LVINERSAFVQLKTRFLGGEHHIETLRGLCKNGKEESKPYKPTVKSLSMYNKVKKVELQAFL